MVPNFCENFTYIPSKREKFFSRKKKLSLPLRPKGEHDKNYNDVVSIKTLVNKTREKKHEVWKSWRKSSFS